MTRVKGHVPVITKVASARELKYERGSGLPAMDECCWSSIGQEGGLSAINSALPAIDGGLPATDALDHHTAIEYKQSKKRQQEEKQAREWFGVSFKPENFIPGQFISFILGCCHWDVFRTDAKSAVPFETMGAMWTTKIVVTCENQQAMNRLKEAAESIGLPTFVVADAGRTQLINEMTNFKILKITTQVLAGSKTVLAIGPASKGSVDSVTGKLRLL
ncbi:hypothetical protein HYC85_027279 [Camellia sinensis]|uniref:peptidyl-tRNA hydrolase n=1 Tax=Camellia sinensis TaxID=4442 RepID=A0A7J7G602_CAMSI|nr:hypothetical protein HYC85_027279 [Camellia sinensis]